MVVGGSILLAAAVAAIVHAARNAASVRAPFAFVAVVIVAVVTHYLVRSFACPSLCIETDVGNYVSMIYAPYTPHTTSSIHGSDTFNSSHVHTGHMYCMCVAFDTFVCVCVQVMSGG